MQVLKTLKRVAAIGTGVAMLGATLTGALALDLKDYPAPFVSATGVYDDSNVFVYGDDAIAADTIAINDIGMTLQYMAKTPVATSGGTVSVTGGKAEKVPLGQGFGNATYFDTTLQDDDVSTLFDGKVNYQGTEYDTSEELQLCDVGGQKYGEPFVATGLMSPDDDYKSNVFFQLSKDKIKYAYKFDKSINLSLATVSNPLEIEFMGKALKIYSVGSAGDSFSAIVGDNYNLKEGDSVTVEGKTVKLVSVGTTTANVDVDGVPKSISQTTSSVVNGIEVYVESVVSKTNLGDSSAILVLGKQAVETYTDGDAYVGEDTDNPKWVWDIAGLHRAGVSDTNGDCETTDGTANNILRIENNFDYNDDTDKPTGVGQCLDLPNKYLSICLDSLSVADTDYAEFKFDFNTNEDLSEAGCVTAALADTSAPAIHLSTTVSEGLDIRAFDYVAGLVFGNTTTNVKSQDAWFFTSQYACNGSDALAATTPWINVFYKTVDSPRKIKWFGAVKINQTTDTALVRLNYGNTKDSNAIITLVDGAESANLLNLSLVIVPDTTTDLNGGAETLKSLWDIDSSGWLTALGATAGGTAEGTELLWVPGRFTAAQLGAKDEDHRTAYGIIVKDPKSSSSGDEVKLMVPNDMVFANVVVKGTAAKVTSGSTSYVPTKVSPVHMAASKVTSPTSNNLIVVGGPCANPLAESVFGQTCADWAYSEGEALVKLVANGEKVALLVAGTSALDTQRAGKALANYDKYAFSGTEVLVKGATLTDITVVPPTVAAPVVEAPAVAA